MNDKIQNLEESLAHLSRVVEELSDVAARQEDEISQLKRRQEMLMRREAEREAAEGGGVQIGDDRPPHW
ncbi:MAG: SlyX family protein [Paracoccaceae bacterium]